VGLLGPVLGQTFSEDSLLGTIGLSSAGNAAQDDGNYVTWVLLLGQGGRYLKATGHQLSVPPDATITGVQVRVKRGATVSLSMTDLSVRLVKGGAIQGSELADASNWPTTPAYASYGGNGQMWGLTLTPADVNASNFGAAIAPSAALAATAQVDCLDISVWYTGSNRPDVGQRFSGGDGMCFSR
jgi:hypothetical protein